MTFYTVVTMNDSATENLKLSDQKNEDAKKCILKSDYVTAVKLLTEAIELSPNVAKYYSNRAACYLKLNRLNKCFEDCKLAQSKDPTFIKAFVREAQYHVAKGEIGSALLALENVRKHFPDDPELAELLETLSGLKEKEARVRVILSDEDPDCVQAKIFLDELMVTATDCNRLRIMQAECLALLGELSRSENLLKELKSGSTIRDPDILFVEGLLLFLNDRLEDAKRVLRDVIRVAPDFEKATRQFKITNRLLLLTTAVETSLQEYNFRVAYTKCEEALQIKSGPITIARLIALNGKIYFNEGLVKKAIDSCNQALALNSSCTQALLLRAKCYVLNKNYESALFDYDRMCILDSTPESEEQFDKTAELFQATLTSDLDYLRAFPNDTKAEIRKNFDELKKKYHPENHTSSSRKEWFEKMYRNILEAYIRLDEQPSTSTKNNQELKENPKRRPSTSTRNDLDLKENSQQQLERLQNVVQFIFKKETDFKKAYEKIELLLSSNQLELTDNWIIRRKLECFLYLEKLDEAEDLLRIFTNVTTDEEIIFFNGLLSFYKNNFNDAKNSFNAVKRIAPDFIKIKPFLKAIQNLRSHIEDAEIALTEKDFDEAILSFDKAIMVDGIGRITKSDLYHSRAKVQYQLLEFKAAIHSCNKALEFDPNIEDVLATRAESYMSLKNYSRAALEFNHLYRTTNKIKYEADLGAAVEGCERSKETFYDLAHLDRNASIVEIQRKFDGMIREFYAVAQEKSPQQSWFNERLKLLEKALMTLLDERLRAVYDKKLMTENPNGTQKVKTYYTILDANASDSQEEIQIKYLKIIKALHPDNCDPDNYVAQCSEIQEAYRVLSNSTTRQHYHRENKKLFQ